jgi:universal stress protein E
MVFRTLRGRPDTDIRVWCLRVVFETLSACSRKVTIMKKLTRLLVVVNRAETDLALVAKAVVLAHRHGAGVELFHCDAERAYALRQSYDPTGVERSRQACIQSSLQYLEILRKSAAATDVEISIDAVCESPLYEAIVHKASSSRPDLVMKHAAGAHPLRGLAWEANDWQLMRACPVTLWLSRGRPWPASPKLAVAVDVSEHETAGLARAILATSECLTRGCRGEVEVIYSEPAEMGAARRGLRAAAIEGLVRDAGVMADRVHVLSGSPEQALPAFAAGRGYDAFVMGALTHREGCSTLVGTLTAKLVETFDCDFILVNSGDRQGSTKSDPAASQAHFEVGLAPAHYHEPLFRI